MQALRLKPLRINNIITTPLIKPEALPNKERPRLYISAFPQPEKSLPKMPYVLSTPVFFASEAHVMEVNGGLLK